MGAILEQLARQYRERSERHRQLPFLRAVMGACAYVVLGGGKVTLGERVAMDRILETLERLRVFDPHEGVALFDEFVEVLEVSPPEGRRRVLEAVDAEVAKAPGDADLLVQLCLAVCGGPRRLPQGERERIAALCRHLALDPCPLAGSSG